jgi:hypothetical protein
MAVLEVGDKVEYVPALLHALQRDPRDGSYPWRIARRRAKKGQESHEELQGPEVEKYLAFIRRHARPEEELKNLSLIAPRTTWPATVTAVNEDDTVNLDIQSPNGFTLHYNGIPVGEGLAYKPHTCLAMSNVPEVRSENEGETNHGNE